jgi:hypothetical protein
MDCTDSMTQQLRGTARGQSAAGPVNEIRSPAVYGSLPVGPLTVKGITHLILDIASQRSVGRSGAVQPMVGSQCHQHFADRTRAKLECQKCQLYIRTCERYSLRDRTDHLR